VFGYPDEALALMFDINYYMNIVLTIIAINLAICLANLPLAIRVQTTLLASMCHALGHAVKKKNIFFDVDIVLNHIGFFKLIVTQEP